MLRTADGQSDQGLHCLLTESLDTTKCMNGEQRNMVLCMCTGCSESEHFALVQRHIFA